MSELDSSALADDKVETAVLRVLQGPGPKGRFVTELLAVLKRSAVQAEEVERALGAGERRGGDAARSFLRRPASCRRRSAGRGAGAK